MVKKIILGVVVFVCLSFAALMGAMFFSPLPFKLIAGGLAKKGIQMEGVGGSLNSGISIEKLTAENEKYSIAFEGAQFRWSSFFKTFVERKVAIELLETRKALVVIKATAPAENPLPQDPSAENEPAQEKDPAPVAEEKTVSPFFGPTNPNGFHEYRIERINIRDVTVKDERRQKEFILQELTMNGLVATEENTVLEQLLVESNQFSISAQNVSMVDDVLDLTNPIVAIIKTPLFPEMIRKDIKLSVMGRIKDKQPESFELKLDEERIVVKGDAQGILFEVKNFTPSEYFVTDFPLAKINAKSPLVPLPEAMKMSLSLQGTVEIASQSFQFAGAEPTWVASLDEGPKKYKVFFAPANMVMGLMMGGGAKGVLELSSTHKDLKHNLANLFFQKSPEALSPEEVANLEKVAVYFKDPTQAAEALVPLAVVEKVPASKGKRQPASLKASKSKGAKRRR